MKLIYIFIFIFTFIFNFNLFAQNISIVNIQFLIDNQYVGGRAGNNNESSISRSLFFDSVSNNHRSNASYNTYEGAYTHIQSSASAFNFKVRTRLQGGTQFLNYASSYDDLERGKPICYYHIIEMEPS